MKLQLTANLSNGTEVSLEATFDAFEAIGSVIVSMLEASNQIADDEEISSLMAVVVPSVPLTVAAINAA